ncbi:MAG: PHP domain-containing protein, partial [Brevinema sp.]
MRDFVNLHVHSHYSILKAIPTIPELIEKTKECRQYALALTDYNNLFAVPEFYKKAKSANVKAIFGIHLEVMEQSRFSSQRKDDPIIDRYSIVLLAKNFQGYQNILKIVSQGYDDGSFGRFCVDKALLQKYASDIIVLSSDHTGELYHYASQKNEEQMLTTWEFYHNTFEHFYIEIQDRNLPEDKITNNMLIQFAHKHNIPIVATNPVL